MEDSDWEYIDPDHRVGVEQDEFASNDPPTSWGNSVVVPYPKGYWRGADGWIDKEIGDDYLGIERAVEHFSDYLAGDKDDIAEAVIRYAKIFWDRVVVFDSDTNAFWYCPKETMDYYTDPEKIGTWLEEYHNGDLNAAQTAIIEGEIHTYHQWAEGEVYVLIAQERHIEHVKVTDPASDTVLKEFDREVWETDEALGGVYFTYGVWGSKLADEMLEYAADNFGAKYAKKKVAH